MQDDTSRVDAIVVVPGGRHTIIAQDNGVIGLWDLEVVYEATPFSVQNQTPPRVGKCLASYHSTSSTYLMKIVVPGSFDELISMVSRGDEGIYVDVIGVVTFTFVASDEVDVAERFRSDDVLPEINAMDISDGLVEIVSNGHNNDLHLMVIDYQRGRYIHVRTTKDAGVDHVYDVMLTQAGNMLVCSSTASGLIVSIYWDVLMTLLGSTTFTDDTTHKIQMTLSPHSIIRLRYELSFPLYITTHR